MKHIQTIDGKIQFEGATTPNSAMNFIGRYPWDKISRTEVDYVAVEEIGRNTRRVFGFGYSGLPNEILPLLRFLYFRIALRAACFCSPSPDWRARLVLSAAEELRRFPEKAKTPLSLLCSCTKKEEFQGLAELLSANIEIAQAPILLEPGIIPDWKFSVVPGNNLIAMMLTSGISEQETIEHAIRFVAKDYQKNEDIAYAALELHREGACSFDEALAMA